MSYAEVSHDQHALENIVVFDFHDHNHNHEHDHEHLDHKHEDEHEDSGGSDSLSFILTIIIAIMGVFMAIGKNLLGVSCCAPKMADANFLLKSKQIVNR